MGKLSRNRGLSISRALALETLIFVARTYGT